MSEPTLTTIRQQDTDALREASIRGSRELRVPGHWSNGDIDCLLRQLDRERYVEYLRSVGRRVEEQDIPGRYRVDDGPAITFGQLMQLAREERAHNVGR